MMSGLGSYVLGSFCYNWNPLDRPRLFYFQTKSYLNRYIARRNPSNRVFSVSVGGKKIYFRDNWFDPRSLPCVFQNCYTLLDPNIFKNISTFVDVGANIGLISACAKLHSPECGIVCFEPLAKNAELCKRNNPDARVEQYALAARADSLRLLVDPCGYKASKMRFPYMQIPKGVQAITLDQYFWNLQGHIDLMKISVEGMEYEVIAGGSKTLSKTRRVIADIHSEKLREVFLEKMKEYNFLLTSIRLLRKGRAVVHLKNSEMAS